MLKPTLKVTDEEDPLAFTVPYIVAEVVVIDPAAPTVTVGKLIIVFVPPTVIALEKVAAEENVAVGVAGIIMV